MAVGDQSQRSLLRWLQNIVVITVIALLVVKLLGIAVFSDRWGWKQAEHDVLVKRFNENAMLARTEWLRLGKPATVVLTSRDNRYQLMMTAVGWPSSDNGCARLWQMLAGGGRKTESINSDTGCVYVLNDLGQEFDQRLIYSEKTGRLMAENASKAYEK